MIRQRQSKVWGIFCGCLGNEGSAIPAALVAVDRSDSDQLAQEENCRFCDGRALSTLQQAGLREPVVGPDCFGAGFSSHSGATLALAMADPYGRRQMDV